MTTHFVRLLAGIALLVALSGCTTPRPYDYSNYHAHRPRSILVLPPLNNSTTVEGTYSYLSTVTRPLSELGYYVFPVTVIDQYLKDNGLPTPGEMHHVALGKIAEVTGADAVLYVTLEQYGSRYELISTTAIVQVTARLVDTRSQTVLWEGAALAQRSSNNGSGNILAQLVAAAIVQAISSKTDTAHGLCQEANAQLFYAPNRRLPYGPYSPKYQSN